MTENVMLYANQDPSAIGYLQRKAPTTYSISHGFVGSVDSALSEKARDQLMPPEHIASRQKPKQPFLRRGTGLQTRREATKQRRYVPRGGFVKDQADADEQPMTTTVPLQPRQHTSRQGQGLQLMHKTTLSANSSLQHAGNGDWHAPNTTPSCAEQTTWTAQGRVLSQLDQAIPAFGATSADCDHEAEMDADSALVHFPSKPSRTENRQLPLHQQQSLQSKFLAPQALQHLHLPMHTEAISESAAPSVRASLSQSQLSSSSAAPAKSEWQLQQATEVCCAHFGLV